MRKIILKGMEKNIDSLIDSIDVLLMKADDDLKDTLDGEGFVKADAAVKSINEIEGALTEALNEHTDDVLKALEESDSLKEFLDGSWKDIRDMDDLKQAIYDALHDRLMDMLSESIEGFIDAYEPDLLEEHTAEDLLTEPAAQFVESWSSKLAELMHLETDDQIEAILLQAQSDALSVADTSLKISESGIRDPGYRSRRVAVTEVLRAESYGQLESMRQCPTIEAKEWMHTGGHKNSPRENHVAISGQQKPVDEPFDLVGRDGTLYHPMVPRDISLPAAESVNCHCIMKRIRSEEAMGMSLEDRRAMRKKYMDEVNQEWEENGTAEKLEDQMFGKDR
ncbi:phage minor head protein [Porcincola intestinalis]|uniref:Phage head morphogenesis domain-containing protein n=1 Tax=Porcincola intestinalis TaxID=2606632 RepID=A0A6L5X1X9_9FIRM|nr:phage minor head protein [Porcincola intestinalis]MSS13645.1 hypothetical protein [Porcincola intestinalis]